ncbi:MAG TPA: hypothetical protein VEL07_09125 [Planctomycetota bacterium]|nr:hypothetical protein [Planctomycetota bacterium]
MPAPTDHDVLRAFAGLFRDLGGDPDRMPTDRAWRLYRAFKDLGAPADVLALVGSWRDALTNAELLQLLQLRTHLEHARSSAHPPVPLAGGTRMV